MKTNTGIQGRGLPVRIKRFFIMLAAALAFAGGCSFIMGPDEPAGGNGGNLSISLGGEASPGSRVITSGANLPQDVLAALRYDLVLTGPNGGVRNESVSGEETLILTVAVGEWRIDARAYQQDVLAGTGSVTARVGPGSNTVTVPMYMSGPCYEIRPVAGISYGTVKASFSAAFAGTSITVTAAPAPDSFFVDNTLETKEKISSMVLTSGSGASHTFTMPAADIETDAKFYSLIRYVTEGGDGDGSSWADASDDVQEMMDELAALPASYTGPRIVKLGAGTYLPEWYPMVPASAGDPYIRNPPGDPQDATFILREGVQIWGGYPVSGNGNRNPAANITTLSGDFYGDGVVIGSGSTLYITNNTENAYHVVLAVNIPPDSGTVLDGLTISGGNANGSGTPPVVDGASITSGNGGGMYNHNSSPVLVNVTIFGNGGGMYNDNSSPVLINVTVSTNISESIYNSNSSPVLTGMTISGNNSAGGSGGGGGMYNGNSSPVLVNVVISGNNLVAGSGGGIYNNNSSPVLVNVVISGNTAAQGGGMLNEASSSPMLINVSISGNNSGMRNTSSSSPVVRNSIIWGNTGGAGVFNNSSMPLISYSIVEGSGGSDNIGGSWVPATGTDNGDNLDTDPLFVDWKDPAIYTPPHSDGDYRLKTSPPSPAIGAGDNSLYPTSASDPIFSGITLSADAQAAINAALSKDLAGNNRFNSTIDMGAYER